MNGKRIVVGVTQRVNMEISHNELRDTLDHKLISWISNSGFIAVPIPNNLVALGLSENSQVSIENWISELNIGALVLSGGNDIGDIPKRDLTERALLSWAEEHKIPTFGICRGMQIMGVYAGSKLVKNDGHVKVRHQLQSNYGDISLKTVNSYHNFSLKECPALYEVIAKSEDGSIEAIKHKTLPWEAWMWHPEREGRFVISHLERFKRLINNGK